MKSRALPVVLVCAALSIAMALASAGPAPSTQAQPAAATWEHLALTHDDAGLGGDLAKQIIRLGNEGWELVCVTPIAQDGSTVKTRYYFKRPKS